MTYSLYLIHILIAARAVNLASRFFPTPSLAQWEIPCCGIAASLAAGWLLFHFGETPLEKLRRSLARKRG